MIVLVALPFRDMVNDVWVAFKAGAAGIDAMIFKLATAGTTPALTKAAFLSVRMNPFESTKFGTLVRTRPL